MKILTGNYEGTGEEHFLEILGKIVLFRCKRVNPTTPGIVEKWASDPGGRHWLQDDAGISIYDEGLEFTPSQGVKIVNNDDWLNAIGEQYIWLAVVDGGDTG